MGNLSRRKGYLAENKLVHMLKDAGLPAWRCPLSGGARGDKNAPPNAYSGFDICIPMLGRDAKIESKHHASGFKRLYDWLAPVDLLMVRKNHADPLVIMPFRTAVDLILAAKHVNLPVAPAGAASDRAVHRKGARTRQSNDRPSGSKRRDRSKRRQ